MPGRETGQPPLPEGTVTFLFSDVEGSTQLARQLGPEWPAVLGRHRELLRSAFVTAGGRELGTEGDSFFVVFPSATAAISAAVLGQRALHATEWPSGAAVRVRMGIHTAEAQPVGDDYVGLEVHRASRIAAAAHGGQVVVSGASLAVLGDRTPEAVNVLELGAHRLKDFPEPEPLHQLVIEGLPATFPALRSLGSRHADLPTQLTSFVGRASDAPAIERLIQQARLVTLTGPGGTGKTRLALHTAAALVERFDDGASFVPLAPVADPALVPGAIAQVVGVQDVGERPLAETLTDWLKDRHLLLVLDNLEHLLGAAPLIAGFLATAPRLHVLATSRESLHLSGEHEYPVSPLAVPVGNGRRPVEDFLASDAVALFVERARAVVPGFELSGANAAAIIAICRRLDGLPLAIELAAARLRILSPEALLERLARSLDLLSSGARDLPTRQRTLRGAIEWSERLLEEPERRLFRALAVFRGGWTLEAAEAVLRGLSPEGDQEDGRVADVFDGISSLAEKSLVRPLLAAQGEPRFLMLETIRAYGIDRLAAEGKLEAARSAHAAYFAELARQAQLHVEGSEGGAWMDRLDREIDNLRAALEWLVERAEVGGAMTMGADLWRYWQRRGHLGEGRRWLERIVALPTGSGLARERARALGALGSVAYWQNDFAQTREAYTESLAAWRQADDESGLQEALYNLGFMDLIDRRLEEARAAYAESRTLAERLGDQRAVGRLTFGLGMVAMVAGELPEARRRFEESIPILEATGDQYLTLSARRDLVEVAIRSGDLARARRLNREVIAETHDSRDPVLFAMALDDLATIEAAEGGLARALRLAGAAAAVKARAGGAAPPPLVTVADVKAEAARSLPADEIERYWEEGRALEDDAAYMLAKEGWDRQRK